MSYKDDAAKSRVEKLKHYDDGGFVRWSDKVNDAGGRGAVNIARGLNAVSRATGLPYNKGAVGVQTNDDMNQAEDISRAVPRRNDD